MYIIHIIEADVYLKNNFSFLLEAKLITSL
jgi:hypothetical protein